MRKKKWSKTIFLTQEGEHIYQNKENGEFAVEKDFLFLVETPRIKKCPKCEGALSLCRDRVWRHFIVLEEVIKTKNLCDYIEKEKGR